MHHIGLSTNLQEKQFLPKIACSKSKKEKRSWSPSHNRVGSPINFYKSPQQHFIWTLQQIAHESRLISFNFFATTPLTIIPPYNFAVGTFDLPAFLLAIIQVPVLSARIFPSLSSKLPLKLNFLPSLLTTLPRTRTMLGVLRGLLKFTVREMVNAPCSGDGVFFC